MKVNEIENILNNFIFNNQKSILIDGDWGVGKTYQVNKFIKNHPNSKSLKIVYISLFGKNSKEEIHTELYSKLHPRINLLNKTAGIISTAITLVPESPDVSKALDFVLEIVENKTDEIKKANGKKKRQNIIILDDLERKGESLDFRVLLGYFNQLLLNNFKIAVICSEKEIDKGKNQNEKEEKERFLSFKEKIFDRCYSVTMADEDVIKSYFQDDSSLLDKEIVDLFNNNLRMASKSSKFYFEVISKLDKEKIEFSKGTLLWYSSLVVVEFNRIDFLKNVKQEDIFPSEFEETTQNIRLKLKSITTYDIEKNHPFKSNSHNEIVEGLYRAYFYNEYDRLILALKPKNSTKIPILNQSLFLLDSDGKRKLLEKKFDYIYTSDELVFDYNLLLRINDMYAYIKYFPKYYDKEKFSEFLAKEYIDSYKDLIALDLEEFNPNFEEIFNKVLEKNKKFIINEILEGLEEAFKSKDIFSLQKAISRLCYSDFSRDNHLTQDLQIQEFVKSKNFFLPDLSGSIEQYTWDISHQICGMAIRLDISSSLKNYLEIKMSNSNDSAEIERYQVLLNTYFSDK